MNLFKRVHGCGFNVGSISCIFWVNKQQMVGVSRWCLSPTGPDDTADAVPALNDKPGIQCGATVCEFREGKCSQWRAVPNVPSDCEEPMLAPHAFDMNSKAHLPWGGRAKDARAILGAGRPGSLSAGIPSRPPCPPPYKENPPHAAPNKKKLAAPVSKGAWGANMLGTRRVWVR